MIDYNEIRKTALTKLVGKWVYYSNETHPERERCKIVKASYTPPSIQVEFTDGKIQNCKFSDLKTPKYITDNDIKFFLDYCESANIIFNTKKYDGSYVTESNKRQWLFRVFKDVLYSEYWDIIAEQLERDPQMTFVDFTSTVRSAMETQKHLIEREFAEVNK